MDNKESSIKRICCIDDLGTFINTLELRFAMIASISLAGFANVSSMGNSGIVALF